MKYTVALIAAGVLVTNWSARAADKWDMTQYDISKLPAAARQKNVTFAKEIRPLLEASCFRCHGEDQQKGGLRLDTVEAVLKGGKHTKVVVPGTSAQSALVLAAAQVHDDIAMPPKFRPGGPGKGPGRPEGPGGPPPGINKESAAAPGGPPAGGPPPGGPGGRGGFGPPPKPLTTEQVALLRAWVDGGAK